MSQKPIEIIIYGAYGELGQKITKKLLNQGIYPLLAGRDPKKLKQISNQLNLAHVCFELINPKTITKYLEQAEVFINCAGSLIANPEPIARAAMQANCHYLDIGGQFHTLTTLYGLDTLANKHNAVICAGIGAECIPGDCLANCIKHHLKELNTFEVAYDINGPLSSGSIKATLSRLSKGNIFLQNGSLITTSYSKKQQKVLFNSGLKQVTPVPTGDLAAVHKSTLCPNVKSYFAISKQFVPLIRLLNWIPALFISKPLQNMLDTLFSKQTNKNKAISHFWAKGTTTDGRSMVAQISTPDIYQLTTECVIYLALYLLKHERSGGVYTPSELMTWRLIENIPGTSAIKFGDMGGQSSF